MSDTSAADGPFEEQRQMYDLLSQETRHLILQHVLGHPAHLPSLDELAYLIPKNKAAIRDQLHVLADEGVVERFEHPPNEGSRDLPSQFYGLTAFGVEVLSEYNYLRGLPVARAIHENTRLSEKAQRHRDAPRPDLPAAVRRALTIDETSDDSASDRLLAYVREHADETGSVDDQAEVVAAFHDAGIGPDHDGIRRTEIAERLVVDIDHQLRTVLSHLVEIDLLEETAPPGPDVFAIRERLDEIVNGNVMSEAEENVEALVAHIDDELQSVELGGETIESVESEGSSAAPSVALADGTGRTIRSILADEFHVDRNGVVEYLRSGDPVERLNAAVDAIESADEVTKSEAYGRIVFVRPAYRYRLTDRALDLL